MKNKIVFAVSLLLCSVSFAEVQSQAEGSGTGTVEAPRPQPIPPAAEPIKPVPNQPVSSTAYEAARTRFTFSVGYSTANKANFDNVKATSGGTTLSGSYEASIDPAFYLAAGIFRASENSWGFAANLIYEFRRNINSERATLNGTTATSTYTNKPSLQITTLEASALYRWERFYLPFGFNYSIVNFQPPSGSTTTTDLRGTLGAQLGAGWFVTDDLSLSLHVRADGTTGSLRSPGPPVVNVDLGTGFVTGLAFQVTYAIN